jgi:uncharacterized phage protein gp47/JayE
MAAHTYNYRRALPAMPRTTVEEPEIMADILSVIPLLSERYTNRNPSDPGMIEFRALARGLDNLSYYLNARRLDVLLDTNITRKSLFQIAAQQGYSPHLCAGARGTMRITLAAPASSGVTLGKWWMARTSGNGTQYYMALADDAAIPAGQTTVDAYAIQGQRYSETFAGTGQPGQAFPLARKKVCAVMVDVDDVAWAQVDSTVGEADDAEVFSVRLGWEGSVVVDTGDGVDGMIVPNGATVTITYLVTSGSDGNEIGGGQVSEAVDQVLDGVTNVTSTTVVLNVDTPAGGEDEEADADIKRHVPRMSHTCRRLGPGNDWQSAFESYAGVERARVVDLNNYDDPDDARYNYLTVYVIPAGGGALTEGLKDALADEIVDPRKSPGMDVIIEPAEYVAVDVTLTVYRMAGYTDPEIQEAVTAAIEGYFDPDPDVGEVDWMKAVVPADLVAEVDKLDGVNYAVMSAPASTVSIGAGQFPVLGAFSLTIVEGTD